MRRRYLLDGTVLEVRIATLRDADLSDIDLISLVGPRTNALEAGDIVAARIGAKATGGVFADLGSQTGFLRTSGKPPAEGRLVLAQVAAPAMGLKSARIVLAQDLAGADPDLEPLRRRMEAERAPGRLKRSPGPVARALAALAPDDRFVVAGARAAAMLNAAAQSLGIDLSGRVTHDEGDSLPLFEAEGVEDAITRALEPVVALHSGGRLILETTEAFTAVDIDTAGARAPLAQLLAEAGARLPREIALRRIAGTVVIDCPGVRPGPFLESFGRAASALGLEAAVRPAGAGLVTVRLPRRRRTLAAEMTRTGATHLHVPAVLCFDHAACALARALVKDPSARRGRFEVVVARDMFVWLEGEGHAVRAALARAHRLLGRFRIGEGMAADGFEIAALG